MNLDNATPLGQPFPSRAPLPAWMQKISLWTPCCVTVTHTGMVHNVPIQHLRVLCCSTENSDVLSHCHWKQCEEKAIFQNLSIANPKARCIKPCRSKQNPRTCLLYVSSSPQEVKVVFYSKVRVTFLPDLCDWAGTEDFQPSSCENKVNALMLCLFCLPLITFEPVGLVQFNLTEGQRSRKKLNSCKFCENRH